MPTFPLNYYLLSWLLLLLLLLLLLFRFFWKIFLFRLVWDHQIGVFPFTILSTPKACARFRLKLPYVYNLTCSPSQFGKRVIIPVVAVAGRGVSKFSMCISWTVSEIPYPWSQLHGPRSQSLVCLFFFKRFLAQLGLWFGFLGSPYKRDCYLRVPRFEGPKPPMN